jgi:hypothetical protein
MENGLGHIRRNAHAPAIAKPNLHAMSPLGSRTRADDVTVRLIPSHIHWNEHAARIRQQAFVPKFPAPLVDVLSGDIVSPGNIRQVDPLRTGFRNDRELLLNRQRRRRSTPVKTSCSIGSPR